MKNIYFLFFFCLSYSSTWAQLTNNGATIVIESGATLIVEGTDIIQASGGAITNDGTITVEGDFENMGTLNSDGINSKIIFKGTANSIFTVGTSTVTTLENEKGNADIDLVGDLTITDFLDFSSSPTSSSKINIDDAVLTLGSNAVILGASSQKYISTNGTGFLFKMLDAAGSFTFPIGNSNGRTELSANFTGSSFTNAFVRVKVNPVADPNLPSDASDYIARHWEVIVNNLSDYQAEVEGKYLSTDIIGTESLIKGASYDASDWSYKDADRTSNTIKGTLAATSSNFTGTNFYGKVDPLVYLQGSSNGAGLMSTDLADAGLIPLSAPYSDAPATATSIPAGTVDWIKVELRDENNPTNVLSKKSGFLLADGSVVDVDGSSLLTIKDAPTTSYVAVYHRNHLPIRTRYLHDLSDPVLIDMSKLDEVYKDGSITTNSALKHLGGLISGMWSGDANGNGTVSYNGGGNDRTSILIKVGFATPNNTTSGYLNEDINMDGNVSYNGGGNDRTPILLNVNFTTPNKVLSAHID